MTSGSVSLKNFSWALKTKKRHRSGSGGSKDHEAKKKSFRPRGNSFGNRRHSQPNTAVSTPDSSGGLEVCAPSTSDVEFKYSWPVEGFLRQVKGSEPLQQSHHSQQQASSSSSSSSGQSSSNNEGLDSKPFEININGVHTKWNLSIRFWTGEDGERLANPFVLCLNMLSCTIAKPVTVGIKFKFGVLNRTNGEFELGAAETKPDLRLETSSELRSVGYKNIAISDKHVDATSGDIALVCKMKLLKDDSGNHSLSSDLKSLINDEKSSDLTLEAGGKSFKVHSNILAARSPVFAELLRQAELSGAAAPSASSASSSAATVTEKDDDSASEAESSKTPSQQTLAPDSDEKQTSKSNTSLASKYERIELKDLKAETLEQLLTYIYTDSSVNVDEMATALLAAADKFQLPGLKNSCEKHFGESISPGNVASVLLLADQYKCGQLKKNALNYCKDNHTYIMKDSAWKTIEEENPDLFEEAVSEVVSKTSCQSHTECLKKKGKRYEIEKNSSVILEPHVEE